MKSFIVLLFFLLVSHAGVADTVCLVKPKQIDESLQYAIEINEYARTILQSGGAEAKDISAKIDKILHRNADPEVQMRLALMLWAILYPEDAKDGNYDSIINSAYRKCLASLAKDPSEVAGRCLETLKFAIKPDAGEGLLFKKAIESQEKVRKLKEGSSQ